MGLLDSLKKATGVGLNGSEHYERAWEKGVLLGPAKYGDAAAMFDTAQKKAAEAQDVGTAARARANAADREALREAILDVECAELEVRAVDKAVAEAVAGLGFPHLPSSQAVLDAEGATRDLERFPKTKNTAANIKSAIEHGQRGGAQADYWIIFETGTHELTDWRWRGHVGT